MNLKMTDDIKMISSWVNSCVMNMSSTKFEKWFFWHHKISSSCAAEWWSGENPHYRVVVNIVNTSPTDLTASAGWDDEGVVTVEINVHTLNRRDITNLSSDLINVIAHELQHLTQWDQPFQRPGAEKYSRLKDERNILEYFTCGDEAEAFAAGCLYESRSSNKSFDLVVNSFLQRYVFEKVITKEEKNKVKKIWEQAIHKVI